MKIIKFTLLITFIFSQLSVQSQKNFEGVITYDLDFRDKSGQMSDDEAKQYIGNTQTYSIKGKKYKTELNGLLKIQVFYPGTDTLFTKMNGVNELMYVEASKGDEKVLSYTIKKSITTIAGYSCNLLEVTSTTGSIKYYYSSKVKINASDFKNHKQGLWEFCLEKTNGALALKAIQDYKDSKVTMVAKTIEKKELDDVIFELPKGLSKIKNPE
jgi:hypothetical protein